MSQHDDYNIADGPGASVRADLNDVLAAIASANSGTVAPVTTFPNMFWFDEANNILKQRNVANTAWVNVAEKSGSNHVPYLNGVQLGTAATKNTGTTGTNIPILSGANSWTALQSILDVERALFLKRTLGAVRLELEDAFTDRRYTMENTGGNLEFKRRSTVDGSFVGELFRVNENGAVVAGAAIGTYLGAGVVNAKGYGVDGNGLLHPIVLWDNTVTTDTANISRVWDNADDYAKIEIQISRTRPSSDATLAMRTTSDGGVGYDSGASDYSWGVHDAGSGGGANQGNNTDSEIELMVGEMESSAGNEGSGIIEIIDPGNVNSQTTVLYRFGSLGSGGNFNASVGAGVRKTTEAVDGFQIFFNGANIAEARIRVIGHRV